MYAILSPQGIEEDSGLIMVTPNFWIVVMVGFQAIAVNGVIMVIPKFRIAMMVGSQAIAVISRMKTECGMVGLMTIIIMGVVPTTTTIL